MELTYSTRSIESTDYIIIKSATGESFKVPWSAVETFIDSNMSFDNTLTFSTALDKCISITAANTNSAINITGTDTAGAYGIYLKKSVTGFAGSSYTGAYIRAEAKTNAATAKSVYGTIIYGTSNAVTHTTGSLWGTLTYAYVKGDAAQTINNIYAGQFEFSMDAGRSNNLTVTTEAAVILAKVTAGKMADDTKLNGMIIRLGDMDGDSATFGNGILIEDDSAMSGTCALTTGINITAGCTNDISLQNGATITNGSAAVLTITEPTVTMACSTKFDVNGMLDVSDELAGGASNGNIIKKTTKAGEDYTGTTAGLMIKMYDTATATCSSGEFTGLYVNLKGLHVDPGHNTSLISAHVHGSNTTTIWAGLWLYGDMTNGIKASGSTLTNMIDISEATAVTNLMTLPAAGTDPVITNALVPAAAPDGTTVGADACLRVLVNDVAYYIPLYDTLHA